MHGVIFYCSTVACSASMTLLIYAHDIYWHFRYALQCYSATVRFW